jgi:site-specific recombinase XerD
MKLKNKISRIDKRLIEEFQNWILSSCSADTVRSYGATLSAYCLGKKTETINRKDFFVELAELLRRKGATLGTISRHTFAVKKFLNFLNEKYDMPVINLSVIKCRKAPAHNPTYLEKHEIDAIRSLPIRTIRELRDRTLFEFLLYTGCRISEALGIDPAKIDFNQGEVEVLGKGNKKRIVFLNDSKDWILKYLNDRGDKNPKHLFLNQYGGKLTRCYGTVAIRELGKRAELTKKIHPHILQHTFGTYAIWSGTDPRTVQEMMGHDDLETTLKYYSAVTQDRMREANVKLGDFIASPQPIVLPRQSNVVYSLHR